MKQHNNNPQNQIYPINVHIGQRLGVKRKEHGFGRNQFAKIMGISFYRLQGYEEGTRRIPCHMLWELSKALQTNSGWFFWNFHEDEVEGLSLNSSMSK